jgi:hypothetical protein
VGKQTAEEAKATRNKLSSLWIEKWSWKLLPREMSHSLTER